MAAALMHKKERELAGVQEGRMAAANRAQRAMSSLVTVSEPVTDRAAAGLREAVWIRFWGEVLAAQACRRMRK
jgi:hypothetical protein